MVAFTGSNLYPFPRRISRTLARWVPGLAASLFLLVQRTPLEKRFLDVLKGMSFETNYFQGPLSAPGDSDEAR